MTEGSSSKSDKRLCACGKCGREVTGYNYNLGQPQRFIHGHNAREKGHPNWNGGRYIDTQGYVRIRKPEHHKADIRGYVFEHILVMEEILGRALQEGEFVHHLNENKSDNRKQNLRLVTKGQHNTIHFWIGDLPERICVDCGKKDTYKRRWISEGLPEGQYRCTKCDFKIWWKNNKEVRNRKRRRKTILQNAKRDQSSFL